jgi:hypothetical protein
VQFEGRKRESPFTRVQFRESQERLFRAGNPNTPRSTTPECQSNSCADP